MSVAIGSIVIRCYEFDRMLQFWQAASHYFVLEDPDGNHFCMIQCKKNDG
jgi:hypothetical protein